MNASAKKEIRLLLPVFLINCVLACLNLFPGQSEGAFGGIFLALPFLFCPAMMVMLALNSFGAEVSSGTLPLLLAQPVSRLKTWQMKISLLAAALLVVDILWCLFFYLRALRLGTHDNWGNTRDTLVSAVMFGLVTYSGGLWTVLLLRQVAAAFWFTLLIPGMIVVVLTGLLAGQSGEFEEGMIVSVLGLYSLAGLFLARWLFLRAQDLQWSGGSIVLPEMRRSAWIKSGLARRTWRPRPALWRKEIQLHQSQFVMAFALLVLHLGVLATRHLGNFRKNSSTEFVLETFWVLWLAMPLLVGCAAVAEERKIGTLDSQLCLPVKQRSQFTIKFLVVLALSLLFGGVMPLLLEGAKILPLAPHFDSGGQPSYWISQTPPVQLDFWLLLGMLNHALPLLILLGIAMVIGMVSFYVSSLTRNTLQALAPATLGLLLVWLAVVICANGSDFKINVLWRGPLPVFTAAPLMLLTVLAMTSQNFKRLAIDGKWVAWNLLILILALGLSVGVTSAIYHRAWQKLTPFEPSHGAARLSLANPPTLKVQWSEISIRLPEGKIWMAHLIQADVSPFARLLGNFKVVLVDGSFIRGSSWLTAKQTYRDWVGIKTNGTLWVSENPRPMFKSAGGGWQMGANEKTKNLVQFGTATNWSSIVPFAYTSFLVKSDGTLWRWGPTHFDGKPQPWPGLQAFTPERLGTESNWAEVYQDSQAQLWLRKADGSLWTWNADWATNGRPLLEVAPSFVVASAGTGFSHVFRSTAQISHGLQFKVGVRDDGTFRIWADERLNNYSRTYGYYQWSSTDVQIGDETNWLAVAGNGEKIVTLRNDGTLWLWDFHYNDRPGWDPDRFENEVRNAHPIRLGTQADWVAISGNYEDVTTLAADGSLWFWPLENVGDIGEFNGMALWPGDVHLTPLLDISRRPQWLGNVFGSSD